MFTLFRAKASLFSKLTNVAQYKRNNCIARKFSNKYLKCNIAINQEDFLCSSSFKFYLSRFT